MALVKTYGNYVLFCLGGLTLLLVFVLQVHNSLDQTFRDPELTVRFSSEDSRHYVEMATAFHEGDWFEGIVERAHRPPVSRAASDGHGGWRGLSAWLGRRQYPCWQSHDSPPPRYRTVGIRALVGRVDWCVGLRVE